jgi:hypothetical protein
MTHGGIPLDDTNRLYIGMCGSTGRAINKKSSIQWKNYQSSLAFAMKLN